MYVDFSTFTSKYGKTYTRHLLRHSFRKNGKVYKKTIANIYHCTDEEIAAIKLAFKHKGNLGNLGNIESLKLKQGPSVGAVIILKKIAQRLNITKVLGFSRKAVLALWLIIARIIDKGSRLSAVRLAKTHAVCEMLNINETFNEDTLYSVLDWCYKNQEKIENELFRIRYKDYTPQFYLYDVTSSYLEGTMNQLGKYGYNRDRKKGKMQIVIGLLTDGNGCPLAVKVFEGNTNDSKTVINQINKLKTRFKVRNITLVGDRGMLKLPEQEMLNSESFNFITAITKPQIEKLIKENIIDIELFDKEIVEIEFDKIRYILRQNPIRRDDIQKNREMKIQKVLEIIMDKNEYLKEHKRAKTDTAIKYINNYLKSRKLKQFCNVNEKNRTINLNIDNTKREKVSRLDGCYVIKTDLKKKEAAAKEIHDRYKDLTFVEQAFRTMKTEYLETRPIFVRKEKRTKGHVFIVMLSYMIIQYLKNRWKDMDITVEEGIKELSTFTAQKLEDTETMIIPQPSDLNKELIDRLDIKIPTNLKKSKINVDTRKKLQKRVV